MPQYFEETPAARSAPVEIVVPVDGSTLTIETDRGVFSRGRLDPGTALLLGRAPTPSPAGDALDLGCGSGPVALALARRVPGTTVWAIDVNERARRLCASNAARNGIANVVVRHPDDIDAGTRFSTIWSNPPIRIGKPALHDLLARWLDRLAPGGRATLVVHRHLGADSLHRWLVASGWPTERLASSRGYRLLHVTPAR